MASYLFYLSPQTGHVFPLVPTMLELTARGHTVTVYCHPPGVATLSGLGLAAYPVDEAIVARAQDDWQATSRTDAYRRAMRTYLDRAPLEVTDLNRAIGLHTPDVLVVDPICWGAGAAAQASGLPWAWAAAWTVGIESRDVPPTGLGLPPRTDLVGRLMYADARRRGARFWRPVVAELNELRGGLGLPPVRSMSELWSTTADVCLIYTAEPLEYPRTDWPASVRLVGPGGWTPPADEPDWLAAVTAPIVLVTCSTERQGDIRLVDTTLRALAGEQVFVVATTAAADSTGLVVPANARVESFLPHGPVLARASCVVCHGGLGIVHAALLAGVPVCAVPFGRDQPEVAMRVQVAGVGVRVPPNRLTPERVRTAVFSAMSMRGRAREVGARLATAGGPATAAATLETLVLAQT
jgi:MGT family glycosyltransferase